MSIKDLLDNQDIGLISGGGKDGLMSRTAASRIQASTCKGSGGYTPKDSFASRAMSAAYRNEPYTKQSRHDQSFCPCPCVLL